MDNEEREAYNEALREAVERAEDEIYVTENTWPVIEEKFYELGGGISVHVVREPPPDQIVMPPAVW